jgi:hypothetical protein
MVVFERFPASRVGRFLPLFTALILGLVYGLQVLGASPLDPFNTSWITGDPAMNQLGFDYMRQESLFTFPLTWSRKLGYPYGSSTAYLDNIPLFATLFKLASPLLPARFQYFGIFFVFSAALQFHFGRRLSTAATGSAVMGWIGGTLFLLAPPFTWRAFGHFALCSQWLILASLYYVIEPEQSSQRAEYSWALPLLCATAASIHPYLALMTLGVSAAALLRKFLALPGRRNAARLLFCGVACCLGTLVSLTLYPDSAGTRRSLLRISSGATLVLA